MIGSNLESSIDMYGTKDIKELIKAMGSENSTIDLFIAYGGSTKRGWEGMTIVSRDQMKEDLKDGIVGNQEIYTDRNSDVNMGSKPGLTKFLSFLSDQPKHERNILILWDHGDAYNGYGLDLNNDKKLRSRSSGSSVPLNMSMIGLQALNSSLSGSSIHWDLIGFDACLMGSYEVALALSGNTDYMLASEENEPWHGWNYSTFGVLEQEPDITIPDLCRHIIDNYVEDPKHQKSKGKTLSLIDMHVFGSVKGSLSDLSGHLNSSILSVVSYREIADAFSHSEPYGVHTDEKSLFTKEKTIDLYRFLDLLGKRNSTLYKPISDVKRAINSSILYSRNDGSKPYSHGLAIYSPNNAFIQEYSGISSKIAFLQKTEWDSLIRSYLMINEKDKQMPLIVTKDDKNFVITDDWKVARVVMLTYWFPEFDLNNESNYAISLGETPLFSDNDLNYILNPKNTTLYLYDENSGEKKPFSYWYVGTENDIGYYYGFVNVTSGETGYEAGILIAKGLDTGNTSFSIYPYQKGDSDEYIFSREKTAFNVGDIITPRYVKHLIGGGGGFSFENYDNLTVTGTISVIEDLLLPRGSYLAGIQAEDYHPNRNIYYPLTFYLTYEENPDKVPEQSGSTGEVNPSSSQDSLMDTAGYDIMNVVRNISS